ncbi:MAG: discoidin domain-containing protein, partial [Bacteroidetes bacterium]
MAGLSLAYHPWLEKEVERGEWNPHAGLRPSYTDGIVPRVSSNARDAARITDGDPGTFWQSGAHLPEGFVARKDLNLFLRSPRCWSAPKGEDTAFADGNFHSFVTVPADSIAQLSIRFQKPQFFSLLGLKAHCSVPLLVEGEFENGDRQLLLTFTPSDNFQLKKTEVKAVFQALHLRSAQPFDLYEVAALDEEPTEWAVFDFGGAKKLGWVRARVWAGEETAYRTEVYASADSLRWDFLGELNPESTETQDLRMSPPIEARYLKIVHYLLQKDWNKVFLWEVDAYDEHGPYGPRPAPRPSSTTLAEFLGVNGYWGWGYKRYSDELPAGHGPALFARLFRHARNYHDLSWDLRRPEDSISFEAMA